MTLSDKQHSHDLHWCLLYLSEQKMFGLFAGSLVTIVKIQMHQKQMYCMKLLPQKNTPAHLSAVLNIDKSFIKTAFLNKL